MGALKAGRYTISVLDETSKAAFVLQQLRKQPVTVSEQGARRAAHEDGRS